MSEFLQVEPMSHDGHGKVGVDPAVAETLDVEPGEVIEITSGNGRNALACLARPDPEDRDSGYVRLDSHLRGKIGVGIGDSVEVSGSDVSPLASVTLAPLSDVSGPGKEELAEYVRETFVKEGVLVERDGIEYVTLPGSDTGTGVKIVESDPERGVMTPETAVEVEFVFSTWGVKDEVTFEDIGGLDEELQLVREQVEFPLRFPDIYSQMGIEPARGIILHGPPGNGKTLVARAISNELDASFHYINGPDIVSTGYGESEQQLRQLFQEARSSLPSAVFIDEMDAITAKREDTGTLADLRLVTQLMELMDGLQNNEGVMVIGTTNRIDAIDPALRRPGRFDREIYIGPPNEQEREDILHIHTRRMLLDDDVSRHLPELARQTNGYSGADLKELAREAGVNALRRYFGRDWTDIDRSTVALSDLEVEREDFERALETVRPSVLRDSISPASKLTWDDVGGYSREKSRIRELVELPIRTPDVSREMGLRVPKGILLTGPHGVGKTLFARVAGNEADATFLQVESSEVFSQWVGKSEDYIKNVFRTARRTAPAIVLIDNLEMLAGEHDDEDDVARRVKNQLRTEIDRLEDERVSLIGTTSDPESIDSALLAAHRFSERIELGLPDESDRLEILQLHVRDVPVAVSEEEFQSIAETTDGWSGAQLESLCQNAKLAALGDQEFESPATITYRHFEEAIETSEPPK